LDSVTFVTASDNPTDYLSAYPRVFSWVVNDGSASNNLSAALSTTVTITAVNDAPAFANLTARRPFMAGPTPVLAPAVSVSDPDNLTLASATVAVTGGTFAGDGDVLVANTSGTGITASYNASTETLTLSGSDTHANYSRVLDTLAFSSGANPTNFGANTTRTLTWVLNDGSASNNLRSVTTTISTDPVVKNDFDGNFGSDLLVQHLSSGNPLSGTPEMWLVNNATVTSHAVLPNPGATWSVAGTGDFNRDFNADILLRNTATGDLRGWEMNGTSVAVDAAIANGVPLNWVISGVGDFNRDGTSDVLWRN